MTLTESVTTMIVVIELVMTTMMIKILLVNTSSKQTRKPVKHMSMIITMITTTMTITMMK